MITGLSGPQRCGKSSLARAYAEKHEVDFIETTASAVFKEMGYDPSITYDFGTRLDIQEEILRQFELLYASQRRTAIADRTPLDLLAYTLGDINGETLDEALEARLETYVENCLRVMNRYFSVLLVVQPGLPLVAAEGKASLSEGYIEHLNTLTLGLSVDERMTVPHYYVPRRMLDMKERLAALEYAINRVRQKAMSERDGACWKTLH